MLLRLFQESVDDLFLGFLFVQSQRHQLHQLLSGDLADGGLVNQRSVHVICSQLGACQHTALIHNNGVTLGVAAAGCVAVDPADVFLFAAFLGNAAADDVAAAALPVEIRIEFRNRMLISGGHDLVVYHQAGALCQVSSGLAQGVVNAGNLGGFHFHVCILPQMHNSGRIHQPLAPALALAVVLFHIAHLAVFSHIEAVNAVMLAVAGAAVVDAAACNDGDIAVLSDVKVIVHIFLQTAFADDDRNMHAFVYGAGFDENINARLVRLGYNVNVGGGVPGGTCAVGTDIVCPHRQGV